MTQTTIGKRIQELRTGKGWSQETLALKAHVAPATVGMIESGESKHPHVGTLEKLSEALGASLGGSKSATPDTFTKEEVSKIVQKVFDGNDEINEIYEKRGRTVGAFWGFIIGASLVNISYILLTLLLS